MKSFAIIFGVFAALLCVQKAYAYQMAYAWASKPTNPSYEPPTAYSYNAGEPITITRTGPGRYQVAFGRVAVAGSHVQVSMYGSKSGFCTVKGWGSGSVSVNCYNRYGNPVDQRFTVLALLGCGDDDEYLAYAWLQNQSSASYTASAGYRFGDGTFAVTRNDVGKYRVNLGSPTGSEAAVLTSGYGGNRQCFVRSWGGGHANVECRNPATGFADARSTVLAIKAGFPHASFVFNSSTGGSLSALWSYSSDGSVQDVVRTAKGRYTVTLGPEANTHGTIQVVTYQTASTCNVASWGDGKAYIRCMRHGGLYDSKFVVLAIA